MLRNDLFVKHHVKSRCESDEKRHPAVPHHLLNGIYVLHLGVPPSPPGVDNVPIVWYLYLATVCIQATLNTS